MSTLISSSLFTGFYITLAIVAIIMIAQIGSGYILWIKRRARTKEHFHDDYWMYNNWNLSSYCFRWSFINIVSAMVVTTIVVILVFLIPYRALNRQHSVIYYDQLKMERASIVNVLNMSEDIINQDIYMRVVNFNTTVASVKAAANNDKYKANFDQTLDWNALDPIIVSKDEAMRSYKIYAGLRGQFGGEQYIETLEFAAPDQATAFARQCAIQIYEKHIGEEGILSYEDIEQTILSDKQYINRSGEELVNLVETAYQEHVEEHIIFHIEFTEDF